MNVVEMYCIGKVKRGPHTSLSERIEDKSNNRIIESYILSYFNVSSDVKDILSDNTIIEDSSFEKVYIDLYGKYKNSRVESEMILVPVNHNNRIPKYINWNDKEKYRNLILADEVIGIKVVDKDYINPKFLFYMMSTPEIIEQLNEGHKLSCSTVENLKIKVVSMEEQLKIVKQLDEINRKQIELDNKKLELEKQAKKILANLT